MTAPKYVNPSFCSSQLLPVQRLTQTSSLPLICLLHLLTGISAHCCWQNSASREHLQAHLTRASFFRSVHVQVWTWTVPTQNTTPWGRSSSAGKLQVFWRWSYSPDGGAVTTLVSSDISIPLDIAHLYGSAGLVVVGFNTLLIGAGQILSHWSQCRIKEASNRASPESINRP